MALSRKRQRELTRLKNHAVATVHDQRHVLEHAASVIRDATRQAADYAREDLSPRAKNAYKRKIRPAVNAGISAGVSHAQAVTNNTRDRLVDDVLPAMSAALGTALAALESTRSPLAAGSLRSSQPRGSRSNGGPGTYILLGLGIVALAGVAYAAWQTVRTSDDLWIDADTDEDANANANANANELDANEFDANEFDANEFDDDAAILDNPARAEER
jgi:hypothetical protein